MNTVERVATALYADLQSLRSSVDTRLAIHSADMRVPGQKRAIRRALLLRALDRAKMEEHRAKMAELIVGPCSTTPTRE